MIPNKLPLGASLNEQNDRNPNSKVTDYVLNEINLSQIVITNKYLYILLYILGFYLHLCGKKFCNISELCNDWIIFKRTIIRQILKLLLNSNRSFNICLIRSVPKLKVIIRVEQNTYL